MCGIVGILSKHKVEINTIKYMNKAIYHRGPDDEGYLIGNQDVNEASREKAEYIKSKVNFGFAHRRLSIIDLSSMGHQPMNYNKNYWITYNGEIYNHIELRSELEGIGYSFLSHTDTEVILAAYDAWGARCLNKFNGMWAFAIYDKQKEEFFISRDRFGIKPLYYYQDNENFIFASEIKSLLANDSVKTSPNLNYLNHYLKKGALEYLKETAFENIYRFNFSSYIILNSTNFTEKNKETKFWDYEVNLSKEFYNNEKAQEIAEEYYLLLKDAVRLRLRADVDVGAALSGGLDSSSIVYLIDEILKDEKSKFTQETFSTVHKSKETQYCDESYYIDIISKKLNIKSNRIEPSIDNIPFLHDSVIKNFECPPEGLGMSSIYTLKLVSQSNVKVTLDGQGADEQQAGYEHYFINYITNTRLSNLYKEYMGLKIFYGNRKEFKVGLVLRLLKSFLGEKLTVLFIKLISNRDIKNYMLPINEKLKLDSNQGLINLIHYSDSRSMCFSIESRMPFMDYRLVEFTANIPSCYKIHNGWTKYFARLAFSGKLPNEITWRKDKMGWPTPDKEWQKSKLKEWYKKEICDSNFLKEFFSRSINKYEKINVKSKNRLLNISRWQSIFFEKQGNYK